MDTAELTNLAENIRGRIKFYTHGSPERILLERSHKAITECVKGINAELVHTWLMDNSVNLTVRQRRILGLEPEATNTSE